MLRRDVLRAVGAVGAAAGASVLAGCVGVPTRHAAKVVVVGGGFGGATAAKYLRMWSQGAVEVTLVEPAEAFVSCPLSNLVLGGSRTLDQLTIPYTQLVRQHGVRWVQARAVRVEPDRRQVVLSDGAVLNYDRLVLSPGVDFLWESLPGLASDAARTQVPHAWKAGAQTLALRQQLQAMPDGGVFAMTIPLAPYRCPPGPYERACQVAHYLKQHKPRAKVLVLDANDDITSKGALFRKAWSTLYPGLVEYRPSHRLEDVDVAHRSLRFETHAPLQADVLNVIPAQRAGDIAVQTGLATVNRRWCPVDFRSFESTVVPGIHVLGDAIQIAPGMPKSGHMANQHAKVCAAAVLDLLDGRSPNAEPVVNNTCYSFVSDREAMHVASVHRFDAAQQTLLPVAGAGGLSPQSSELEGNLAQTWAKAIWADSLG